MKNLCIDDPKVIYDTKMCLNAVSKNLEGDFNFGREDNQLCKDPQCGTRKMVHELMVRVKGHACDSSLGKILDGELRSGNFTSAFEGPDCSERGFHTGDFKWWNGKGLVIEGRMSGMTNVGTLREPFFKSGQACREPGIMEGRLCGAVAHTEDPKLEGCWLIGTYRFRFDTSKITGKGQIQGTFEGSFWCKCRG